MENEVLEELSTSLQTLRKEKEEYKKYNEHLSKATKSTLAANEKLLDSFKERCGELTNIQVELEEISVQVKEKQIQNEKKKKKAELLKIYTQKQTPEQTVATMKLLARKCTHDIEDMKEDMAKIEDITKNDPGKKEEIEEKTKKYKEAKKKNQDYTIKLQNRNNELGLNEVQAINNYGSRYEKYQKLNKSNIELQKEIYAAQSILCEPKFQGNDLDREMEPYIYLIENLDKDDFGDPNALSLIVSPIKSEYSQQNTGRSGATTTEVESARKLFGRDSQTEEVSPIKPPQSDELPQPKETPTKAVEKRPSSEGEEKEKKPVLELGENAKSPKDAKKRSESPSSDSDNEKKEGKEKDITSSPDSKSKSKSKDGDKKREKKEEKKESSSSDEDEMKEGKGKEKEITSDPKSESKSKSKSKSKTKDGDKKREKDGKKKESSSSDEEEKEKDKKKEKETTSDSKTKSESKSKSKPKDGEKVKDIKKAKKKKDESSSDSSSSSDESDSKKKDKRKKKKDKKNSDSDSDSSTSKKKDKKKRSKEHSSESDSDSNTESKSKEKESEKKKSHKKDKDPESESSDSSSDDKEKEKKNKNRKSKKVIHRRKKKVRIRRSELEKFKEQHKKKSVDDSSSSSDSSSDSDSDSERKEPKHERKSYRRKPSGRRHRHRRPNSEEEKKEEKLPLTEIPKPELTAMEVMTEDSALARIRRISEETRAIREKADHEIEEIRRQLMEVDESLGEIHSQRSAREEKVQSAVKSLELSKEVYQYNYEPKESPSTTETKTLGVNTEGSSDLEAIKAAILENNTKTSESFLVQQQVFDLKDKLSKRELELNVVKMANERKASDLQSIMSRLRSVGSNQERRSPTAASRSDAAATTEDAEKIERRAERLKGVDQIIKQRKLDLQKLERRALDLQTINESIQKEIRRRAKEPKLDIRSMCGSLKNCRQYMKERTKESAFLKIEAAALQQMQQTLEKEVSTTTELELREKHEKLSDNLHKLKQRFLSQKGGARTNITLTCDDEILSLQVRLHDAHETLDVCDMRAKSIATKIDKQMKLLNEAGVRIPEPPAQYEAVLNSRFQK